MSEIGAVCGVNTGPGMPRQRKVASTVYTEAMLPSSAHIEPVAEAVVSRRRRANIAVNTLQQLPDDEPISGVSGGGEVQRTSGNHLSRDLAATIAELVQLQSQRRFCIVSQSRCDRSVESFIARLLGYGTDLDPKQRVAMFKEASAVRKAVEKGGEGHVTRDHHGAAALSAAIPLIVLSAGARESWDKHRGQVEKRMRSLAHTLPAWSFVEAVAGFGDLGLSIIVGEAGDLSNYATKERLWKRLGLAVIEGERQQRRSNAEQAAAHGYSPKRRAEIWTIADSMFRHQWAAAKDDAPAQPKGPYGAIYAARKAHTVNRDGWTLGHRENDARRIMTKALIENLWRAWNGKEPIEPPGIFQQRLAA